MSLNATLATLDRLDQICTIGRDSGDPGCDSCARTTDHTGHPRWEPVAYANRTDVKGRLTEPRWLCRWCYDYVLATGQLPTRADLVTHHSGRNVRKPA